MALDKVVDSAELDAGLTKIADAIREKGGTTVDLKFPEEMETAVKELPAVKVYLENGALRIR